MPAADKKIQLLVVEDSAVQRELLIHMFNSDPAIQVISWATNGVEAIEALKRIKPDIVLMDLHMPKMNGIECIRHIMKVNPLPIVAMSASSGLDDTIDSFHALEAGAVAFSEKPKSIFHSQYDLLRSNLLQTIKLMSEVPVVRRWYKSSKKIEAPPIAKEVRLIVIGVSTGGPLVLKVILSLLPLDFPPILIVQHISPGFVEGLAEWLTPVTHHKVSVAKEGELPKRSHVYLAPDYHHMGLSKSGTILLKADKNSELCPSVNFLFNSVANNMKDKALGILLTGMGSDGATGLKEMKEQGAVTIAQSEETSLIYGMPHQAVKLHAATYILTPEEIAKTISSLSQPKGDI